MPYFITPPITPIPASCAIQVINNLNNLAVNLLATSSSPLGTSALTAQGYISNLINSSAMSGSSANLYGALFNGLLGSSATYLQFSSSAPLYASQLLGASSAMAIELTVSQLGYQVSS